MKQNKFDEAEPLMRRGFEVSERVLGAEHPDTLVLINTLANVLEDQGKLDEAETLFRRCLEVNERVLERVNGAEDPGTQIIINNLGNLLSCFVH